MEVDELKQAIKLMSNIFLLSKECDNSVGHPNFSLPTNFSSNVGFSLIKNQCEKIPMMIKSDIVKRFSLAVLSFVFIKTTSETRLVYFSELTLYSYDILFQKLIEKDFSTSILTKDKYNAIIRELIPVAKLSVLNNAINVDHSHKNIILKELHEYIENPRILREDCYNIINSKLGTNNNIVLINYTIEDLPKTLGFLGEYAKLIIRLKDNGTEFSHEFFVKFLPTKADKLTLQMTRTGFLKEGIFYNKYIPALKKLRLESCTNIIPKCYLQTNSFIVLDNATDFGYTTPEIGENLDYDRLLVTVKNLAELHSTSIVLEHKLNALSGQTRCLDAYFPEFLHEIFIHDATDLFTAANQKNILIQADKFENIIKDISMEEFKKRLKVKVFDKVYSGFRKSNKYKNVLCHGDIVWMNLMYKNDPLKCWLIDFQMCRYVPPALELLILFYMCTDQMTRTKYMLQLVEEYYLQLQSHLIKHSINITKIIPYDQFIESLRELQPCAVYLATSNHFTTFLPEETKNQLFEDPVKGQHFWTVDRQDVYNEIWQKLPLKRYEENYDELYKICLQN